MTQKTFTKNPMAAAFGAAILASAMSPAMAGENPFAAKTLASGYELAMGNADKAAKAEAKFDAEKAGAEAQCGADKAKAAKLIDYALRSLRRCVGSRYSNKIKEAKAWDAVALH